MKLALGVALSVLYSSALVAAQTYTNCNPLEKSCPADPALGKSNQKFDFTSGSSSEFTASGSVSYDNSNGATFTISQKGDGPLIQSNWYIMFGRVEFTIKAAPGTGIVSSAVLQSDDLDEIDWEWLGGNNAQVQTNYFGKGDTSTYSRGAYHDNSGNHDSFHTYSVDWTSSQIVWAIDGKTVRVLTPDTADSNQYPQTPMMIKAGVWAGGDPGNAQGTIDWAGGETDYNQGPFSMYLKSMTVTDYSTGNSYSYGDKSGSWESIIANNGKVNGNSGDEPTSTESAPVITATVDSVPIPWSGTHKETSSWVTPNVWPWVATDSPTGTAAGSLPSGWESRSNNIQPPGGGSVSERSRARRNSSMESITKTKFSSTQSTFLSTSAPSVSSSVAFSPSGLRSSSKNVTRHASKTTTEKHRTRRPTDVATATAENQAPATTMSSHDAPSANSGATLYHTPAALGTFCVIFGGFVVGGALFGGTVMPLVL
ncbi:hypothetical protein N7532_008843 [Penicillium argentinense]|uniref:Crh-like protein n=1 Tax=Penicillium argentinense TaxID=1131581 RepID=A0A9W9EYC5_9EURO|nr:uncharacterized protein N7532_008843 [Penicillium argentinense]KAJ5090159.1 hypothetical protein N7532_008843 [Penicillium argentinense]